MNKRIYLVRNEENEVKEEENYNLLLTLPNLIIIPSLSSLPSSNNSNNSTSLLSSLSTTLSSLGSSSFSSSTSSSSSSTIFIQAIIITPSILFTFKDLTLIRKLFPTTFLIIYNPLFITEPLKRLQYFDCGINMISYDLLNIYKVINDCVIFSGCNNGNYKCSVCGLENLTENELWNHLPTYHINVPNQNVSNFCPICEKNCHQPLQVHIHEYHGPSHMKLQNGSPLFYGFSLVVCRHPITGLYLLCQEFCNQGFWVPGGAVDPGETFITAAKRETIEEAGIDIEIKGILGIDHEPHEDYVRMRVIFYAEPIDNDQLPKSIPNYESAGACWCTKEEINSGLRLRGKEPKHWSR